MSFGLSQIFGGGNKKEGGGKMVSDELTIVEKDRRINQLSARYAEVFDLVLDGCPGAAGVLKSLERALEGHGFVFANGFPVGRKLDRFDATIFGPNTVETTIMK